MAINPLELLQLKAPNFMGVTGGISRIINIILWVLIISVALFVFFKFAIHRVFVEIMPRVKGGYVCQGGRYAINYDKQNKLEYLQPMFGRERLPAFPSQAYQKCKGLPFIGILRELSLIELNRYNYKVSLPTTDKDKYGETRYYNTLNWVFLEQRRQFLKHTQREQMMNLLSMLAPMVVILIGFGLVAWALYVGVRADTQNAQFLAEMVKTAQAASGG